MTVRLVVFDVDGTLYDQRRLRALMLAEILGYVLRHPLRYRDILIVREYRRVHEQRDWRDLPDLEAALQSEVATRLQVSRDRVREVVDEWMFRRPLRHLPSVGFDEAREVIDELHKAGVATTFLSDHYPVDKLAALGLTAESVYYSTRADLNCLKPNPKLLASILKDHGVRPSECVVVGDRPDRDGELARLAGAHFVLFPALGDNPSLFARITQCVTP